MREALPHFSLTSVRFGAEWFITRPFTLWNSVIYPLKWNLGGTQKRSGRFGEENKCLTSTGKEPRFLSWTARSLIIVRITLY